ncbi:hypothetical protein PIB30_054273 [Stylosanthes scabra]|uniref:Uncharacterized protein n=1 Tax=Stylosanthes scabra TaxID=79078 RepID=A0ABU6UHH0_9FABA|nr:hypothetical protein [Stylosanthes scabra]
MEGSLDVWINAVKIGPFHPVEDGKTQDGEGSNGVEQDPHANSCQTFDEVMGMEFDALVEDAYFMETIPEDKQFIEHRYTQKPIISKFKFLEANPPHKESGLNDSGVWVARSMQLYPYLRS